MPPVIAQVLVLDLANMSPAKGAHLGMPITERRRQLPSSERSGRQGLRGLLNSSSGMVFGSGMVIPPPSAPYDKCRSPLNGKTGQSIRSRACTGSYNDVTDLMQPQLSRRVAAGRPQRPGGRAMCQNLQYDLRWRLIARNGRKLADSGMDFSCRCGARRSISLVRATAGTGSVESETGAEQVSGLTVLARLLDLTAMTDFAVATAFCTPDCVQSEPGSSRDRLGHAGLRVRRCGATDRIGAYLCQCRALI